VCITLNLNFLLAFKFRVKLTDYMYIIDQISTRHVY